MTPPKNILQKQLEQQRFLSGVQYVEQAAQSIKKINSSELAQLNQILTNLTDEPWRFQAVQVQIPTGHLQQFNLLSNPIQLARDIIGSALLKAGNGDVIEAAADLYSELVLKHLFEDANRRTAVLATLWILNNHNYNVDAQKLLDVPIGNLRNQTDLDKLKNLIQRLVVKNGP